DRTVGVDELVAGGSATAPAVVTGGGPVELDRLGGDATAAQVVGSGRSRGVVVQRVGRVQQAAGDRLALEGLERAGAVHQAGFDLLVGRIRVNGRDQAGHAGDVRGRHRRSAPAVVLVAGQRGVDVHARGAQVDRGGAVVGEVGQGAVAVDGGDAHDVRELI